MKIFEYRQYWYGGQFSNEKIKLPDDALIFKIGTGNFHVVEDKWTYSVLILTRHKLKKLDKTCLGDWFVSIIDNVYSSYQYDDYEDFPKLNFYLIESNINNADFSLPIVEIEKNSIWRISKFRRIDENKVFFSRVQIKNYNTMNASYSISYEGLSEVVFENPYYKIAYGKRYDEIYEEFFEKTINVLK